MHLPPRLFDSPDGDSTLLPVGRWDHRHLQLDALVGPLIGLLVEVPEEVGHIMVVNQEVCERHISWDLMQYLWALPILDGVKFWEEVVQCYFVSLSHIFTISLVLDIEHQWPDSLLSPT